MGQDISVYLVVDVHVDTKCTGRGNTIGIMLLYGIKVTHTSYFRIQALKISFSPQDTFVKSKKSLLVNEAVFKTGKIRRYEMGLVVETRLM